MRKYACPANCGRKFISPEHARAHADSVHPKVVEADKKRKGWCTPYGFGDFTQPVTYEEACEEMKVIGEKVFSQV